MAAILKYFVILGLGLLFSSSLYAQELLWPLEGHKELTGGFADSRTDHFHGGLDIRTRGENLPVLAPTDGWIERISVNPAGYGHVLYFRLSDGRTAVFGHLDRFEPVLQKVMRDSQLVAEIARIDCIYETQLPQLSYKKGEILAYTGQTGMGPPHLHYEIREGAVQTDPLRNYKPKDTQAPVITALSWVSYSNYSPTQTGVSIDLSKHASKKELIISSDEPIAFYIQTYDPGPFGRHAIPMLVRIRSGDEILYSDTLAQIDLTGPKAIYEKLVFKAQIGKKSKDLWRIFSTPSRNCAGEKFLQSGWLSNLKNAPVAVEVVDRAGNISSIKLTITCGVKKDIVHILPETECADSFTVGKFTISLPDNNSLSWANPIGYSVREFFLADEDIAFSDRVKLKYAVANNESCKGLYFYKLSGENSRAVFSTSIDTSGYVSCTTLRGGTYGIGEDHLPPELAISVKHGKITYKLTDFQSGVDDATIRCKVNNTVAIADFEFEERGGTVWTQNALKKGTHSILFSASDKAGNSNIWVETVTLK